MACPITTPVEGCVVIVLWLNENSGSTLCNFTTSKDYK
jgi:hypothetical protein